MRYYGLSEARVRRILHTPDRIEEGIASGTIAFMQKTGNRKKPSELWAMAADEGSRRKVISAWRYPGETKPQSDKLKEILMAEINEYFSESVNNRH